MSYVIIRPIVILLILFISISTTHQTAFAEEVEVYISGEISSNIEDSGLLVDDLANKWLEANIELGACENCFESFEIPLDEKNITQLVSDKGTLIDISLRDITDVGNQLDLGVVAKTQLKSGSASSKTLQGDAPKPATKQDEAYLNEQSGSSSSRNGVLFGFPEPTKAFGAWFGDLETRNDGQGTAALMRLYGLDDTLLREELLQSNTNDQSACGDPVDDDFAGCGNNTTRWISFVSDGGVSKMLVIVGDDDATLENSDGNKEHLSFTGLKLINEYSNEPEMAEIIVLDNKEETTEPSIEEITEETIDHQIEEELVYTAENPVDSSPIVIGVADSTENIEKESEINNILASSVEESEIAVIAVSKVAEKYNSVVNTAEVKSFVDGLGNQAIDITKRAPDSTGFTITNIEPSVLGVTSVVQSTQPQSAAVKTLANTGSSLDVGVLVGTLSILLVVSISHRQVYQAIV